MITTELLELTCKKCGNGFTEDLPTHCRIEITVAAMRSARCPRCKAGGKSILLGRAPGSAPRVTSIHEWIVNGEVGISSKTIACAVLGMPIGHHDLPHDPDDFRRCRQLLATTKDTDERRRWLNATVSRHPYWEPMVDAWDRLDGLYEREQYRELYREIQLLRVECLRIQYPKAKIETYPDGTLRSLDNRPSEAHQ